MQKTPREVLAEAAKAAAALVPEQERLIQKAESELSALRTELHRLQEVAALAPQGFAPIAALGIGPFPTAPRPPSLSVFEKIERILRGASQPLSPREISGQIEKIYGDKVPTSTLYGVLAKIRGLEGTVYQDGKLSLKKVEAHE